MQRLVRLARILLLGLMGAAPTAAGQSPFPERVPIILDSDIGTDIDDAFALALIIDSPEFELLGVTTVSGDTLARARLVAKLLWEAGGAWRKVPVYAGEPAGRSPSARRGGRRVSPALHCTCRTPWIS